MFTPELGEGALDALSLALTALPRRDAILSCAPLLPKAKRVCSIREALFSPFEEVSLDEARGRVLSSASIACPPAVPICICGEEIGLETIECLSYFGVSRVRVCK